MPYLTAPSGSVTIDPDAKISGPITETGMIIDVDECDSCGVVILPVSSRPYFPAEDN